MQEFPHYCLKMQEINHFYQDAPQPETFISARKIINLSRKKCRISASTCLPMIHFLGFLGE